MVVYENFFLSCLRQKILTALLKHFLIDNHYKTIFVSVRNEYSSPTVINEKVLFGPKTKIDWSVQFTQCEEVLETRSRVSLDINTNLQYKQR